MEVNGIIFAPFHVLQVRFNIKSSHSIKNVYIAKDKIDWKMLGAENERIWKKLFIYLEEAVFLSL